MLSSFAVARDRLTPVNKLVTRRPWVARSRTRPPVSKSSAPAGLIGPSFTPAKLTNGPRTEPRVGPETEEGGTSQRISRAGVASFLLQSGNDGLCSRRGVV